MSTWELAAIGAVGWAWLGLAAAVLSAWRRGTPRAAAAPAGSAWAGVAYAFGPGMHPRAKESASKHPWVYAAGMLYHAGVAAAVGRFVAILGHVPIGPVPAGALAVVLLAALLAGAALAARRAGTAVLRSISAPDDYAANLLVDIWLATAAFSLLKPTATPAFLVATTVLGIYAPLGKIRHCVFFFLARGHFGARLGRRGVVRPRGSEA